MPFDPTTHESVLEKQLQAYQSAFDERQFDAATNACEEILALAEDWCANNFSEDLRLRLTAGECENRADWDGAEAMYLATLALPNVEPDTACTAHADLAGLYRLLQRHDEALVHARRAVTIAREIDSQSILLAMMLRGEARCCLRCGDVAGAQAAIQSALAALTDDRRYNQMIANLLTMQAECDLHSGKSANATNLLEQASELLEPYLGMEMAGGVYSDLAQWWTVTAQLHALRGGHATSLSPWKTAVAKRLQVASLPQCDNVFTKAAVADALQGLADAYLTCGFDSDAADSFAARRAILDRAGLDW